RNITATRSAYGLNKVQVDSNYNYSPTVSKTEIQGPTLQAQANQQTLANVRLLDPAVALTNTFDKLQGERSYYQFNELDLDRYALPADSATGSTSSQTKSLTATIAS